MAKPTVLLVEDNDELRATVRENLEADGYEIITASSAEDLLKRIGTISADTILLDLVLPDADGLTLMSKIRDHTDAPVIIVSGKAKMVDVVVGLEMGADDYVGKPFEMHELAARIKAHVRRYRQHGGSGKKTETSDSPPDRPARIKFGSFVLDRTQFQAFDGTGRPLGLTVMEFRLLDALVSAPNRVLSREQLLDKARQDNPDIYDRAIDVQIARIRKKLGGESGFIRTVRGAGYMFVAETESADD